MTGPPNVSVVVPYFDSRRHLAACVESLLAQVDAGPFEIILVNNGSRDGSPSIAARYTGLVLLEEPSQGAYAARNTGIRRAGASLIAFTDADCVVGRSWLRSIQDGMQDPSVGILVGAVRYPASASHALRLLGAYENLKAEYVIDRREPAHHFAYANNMAVRASVFQEIGLFKDWRRAADSELVHRLAACRPDLRLAFRPSMEVTHLEFTRVRDRLRRLSMYTRTNSQIATFRELGIADRVGLLAHGLFHRRNG